MLEGERVSEQHKRNRKCVLIYVLYVLCRCARPLHAATTPREDEHSMYTSKTAPPLLLESHILYHTRVRVAALCGHCGQGRQSDER